MHALPPTLMWPHQLRPLRPFTIFIHWLRLTFPPFVDNFHPEADIVLDKEAFIFALTRSPHLSCDGPPSMVYELLQNCFVPNNFVSGFDIFFEICKHIIRGHFPPSVSHLFIASLPLALEKQAKGIRPIVIREVIYWLVTRILAIQFKDTFAKYFSPH